MLEMRLKAQTFTPRQKTKKQITGKRRGFGCLRPYTDLTDLSPNPHKPTSRWLESNVWFNHISEDYKEALKLQGWCVVLDLCREHS